MERWLNEWSQFLFRNGCYNMNHLRMALTKNLLYLYLMMIFLSSFMMKNYSHLNSVALSYHKNHLISMLLYVRLGNYYKVKRLWKECFLRLCFNHNKSSHPIKHYSLWSSDLGLKDLVDKVLLIQDLRLKQLLIRCQ